MTKSKKARIPLFVVLLMALAVVLAACGDPTATTAPATTAAATTAAATTAKATTAGATTGAATTAAATTAAATTAAATTAAVASSGHPGISREAWYGPDPTTLDPQASQPGGYTTLFMYRNLYLGLTDYDETLKVIPGIAKEWKANPPSTVWTFTLNPAAKFSSGKAVTANDVAYTYERAVDPKIKNAQALGVVGDIKGASDKFAGKADKVEGIKVVDDTTIEFTLSMPTPFFPSKLSLNAGYILDKDIVESGAKWWETKSAGAGPFQLSEWQHNQKIVLTPNPGWLGSKVKLTRIEYLMVGDQTNRLNLYQSGQTDHHWQLLTAEIDQVKKDPVMGKELTQLEVGYGFTFALNMNANGYEPFKDAKVRKAILMALDSKAINETPLNGAGIQATGLIPNSLPGYKAGQMKTTYDPAGAKKLLAETSYGDGSKLPELVLTQVGSGPDIAGTTQFVQEALKTNLGMNVRIDVTDQQRFVPLVQQGKVAAWATLMVTAYPDQYSMLSNFHSKSPFNYWGYNSPEVDGLLAQALGTQDEKARIAIYNQVEAKLMDDAAIMPIMWGKFYFLQKPYVSGFRTNPLGIMAYTNLEIK